MATWKKILHESSEIAITQIENLDNIDEGHIIIGSAAGQADNHLLPHKQILMGDGSNHAKTTTLVSDSAGTGDIIVHQVLNGSGITQDAKLKIVADAVITSKIKDDNVTIAKLAHQNAHGIMVYDDSAADGTGIPTFVTGGAAGEILKVNSSANGFEFAAGSSASTVDISLHDTTRRAVIIGGINDDNSDTGSDSILRKDFPNFSYKEGETFASAAYKNHTGSTVAPVALEGTADLHVPDIKTNITGTAGTAMRAYVSNDNAATDQEFAVTLASQGADGGQFADSGPSHLVAHKQFTYNPVEGTLTVNNLRVTGTNTIVDTVNLAVQDQTIRVATSNSTSTAQAQNSGIVVNIGDGTPSGTNADETGYEANADNKLPRVLWSNSATTTQGWVMASKGSGGSDASITSASNEVGIAAMNHSTGNITQSTLNSLNDHGIGAFYLVDTDATPELYIQVG